MDWLLTIFYLKKIIKTIEIFKFVLSNFTQQFAISLNIVYLKYGLHALKTTLCAVNDRISQANVTSTKSSSSRKCRNDDKIELWKSFHLRAYCCSDGDGVTARSIFVVVVLLFSVVCNSVDSVISLVANKFFLPNWIRCMSTSNLAIYFQFFF